MDCLDKKGAKFLLPPLQVIALNDPPLVCRNIPDQNSNQIYAATKNGTLFLNDLHFWSLDESMQRVALFHELVHLALDQLGMDEPDSGSVGMDDAERQEKFRVHACAAMCFPPNPDVTKCACIKCLFDCKDKGCFRQHCCEPNCRTKGPADSRPFEKCKQDLGAFCKCKGREKWYDSHIDCEVSCPSGLRCFASHCKACDDPDMCT